MPCWYQQDRLLWKKQGKMKKYGKQYEMDLLECDEKRMLFIYGNMTLSNGKYQRIQFPYFRHGIIRGEKG